MKLRLNEAPDAYGLPTDDELYQELAIKQNDLKQEFNARKAKLEREAQSRQAEIHRQRVEKESSIFANAYPIALDLLSTEEATKLPIQTRKYMDWWWLRSPGDEQDYAAYIENDGFVGSFGDIVTYDYGDVRPALMLSNLDSSNLELYKECTIFDKKWIYIGDNRFLYNDKPVEHRFDKESNDYETSEIKRFLDDWLKELQSKSSKNESYKRSNKIKRINESSSIIPSAKLKDIFSDLDDIETICGDTFNWSDSSWTYDAVRDLADALGACISSLRMNCRG